MVASIITVKATINIIPNNRQLNPVAVFRLADVFGKFNVPIAT